MPGDFPPGDIGSRFNKITALGKGEFVYVRMQVYRAEPSDFDSFALKLLMRAETAAFRAAWQVLWVPRSQIVCREPKAMYASGGTVRGID